MSIASGTIGKQLILYGQILTVLLSSFCLLCEVNLGFLENKQRFRLPLYAFRFSSLLPPSHTHEWASSKAVAAEFGEERAEGKTDPGWIMLRLQVAGAVGPLSPLVVYLGSRGTWVLRPHSPTPWSVHVSV